MISGRLVLPDFLPSFPCLFFFFLREELSIVSALLGPPPGPRLSGSLKSRNWTRRSIVRTDDFSRSEFEPYRGIRTTQDEQQQRWVGRLKRPIEGSGEPWTIRDSRPLQWPVCGWSSKPRERERNRERRGWSNRGLLTMSQSEYGRSPSEKRLNCTIRLRSPSHESNELDANPASQAAKRRWHNIPRRRVLCFSADAQASPAGHPKRHQGD